MLDLVPQGYFLHTLDFAKRIHDAEDEIKRLSPIAMLDIVPQGDFLHTLDFAKRIHNAEDAIKRLPILAMDAYKITDNTDILLKKTFGKFSHRFILIEIGTSPLFFARIDFQGDAPLGDQPITQSIILSTDRTSIAPASVSFARMSNPNPGGPTLDAFATLLEIMHRRTYKYDLFSRNCFWMSETILYATGRRYSDYWRAANIEPPPLRRYVEYAIGANTATVEIHHNEPAERFFVDVGLQIVKGIQWLFSYPAGESRIRFPDEEVEGILSEWK